MRPRRAFRYVRFVKFNSVGAAGFVLQIAVLAVLLHAGVHYLAATAVAVESAIMHNFVWHERWTWRDRPAATRGRLERLWRFHALNGTVSLVGNVLLMRVFVGTFGLAAIPANLLAVLACALANYFASDRIVFARWDLPPEGGNYSSFSGGARVVSAFRRNTQIPSAMISSDSDVA